MEPCYHNIFFLQIVTWLYLDPLFRMFQISTSFILLIYANFAVSSIATTIMDVVLQLYTAKQLFSSLVFLSCTNIYKLLNQDALSKII